MRSPLRELRQPFGSKRSGRFRNPGRREPKYRERSGTQQGPSACLTGRIGNARQRFRSPVRRALLPVQSAFTGVDMIRDAAARPTRPVNQCRSACVQHRAALRRSENAKYIAHAVGCHCVNHLRCSLLGPGRDSENLAVRVIFYESELPG
jgi:hypothetical protein